MVLAVVILGSALQRWVSVISSGRQPLPAEG
jgi:hypothetical protein